jgi:hypothetical protein
MEQKDRIIIGKLIATMISPITKGKNPASGPDPLHIEKFGDWNRINSPKRKKTKLLARSF